ncbi:MAG: response regulator transcription factor [Flavobacteriales bacterium]|nr:response regulator transcription factor [Flavobacteriales bacterium]
MWRSIIIYGSVVALLVFVMNLLDFHFLIHSLAMEYYLGLVALVFAVTGAWVGWQLTQATKKDLQIHTNEAVLSKQEPSLIQTDLSPREIEVLHLIAQGFSNQEIADRLFVSLNTVKSHSSNVFVKLDVKRRTQAVQKARELGLLK